MGTHLVACVVGVDVIALEEGVKMVPRGLSKVVDRVPAEVGRLAQLASASSQRSMRNAKKRWCVCRAPPQRLPLPGAPTARAPARA